MSNLLQTLKTVTLSHEAVLTALCALGAQRTKDQALLETCAEGARAWVKREIAMVDTAIAGLQSAAYAVRYCHACGHVGDVLPPARDCCTNGQLAAMVHPAIARQARAFRCALGAAIKGDDQLAYIEPLELSDRDTLPMCGDAEPSLVSEMAACTSSTRAKLTTWSTGDAFKNSVVALAPTCFALQFIREAGIKQMIDAIREVAKTCHANAAVNITLIIAYADLHALHLDEFFVLDNQLKLVSDLPIEIRYLLAGEDGALHFFHGPLHMLNYVGKYFAKRSLA